MADAFLTSHWTRLTANESIGRVSHLHEVDLSFRLRLRSTSADWQTVLDLGGAENVWLPLVYVVPHRGKYDRNATSVSHDSSSYDEDGSYDELSSYSYTSVEDYSYSYSNWDHSYGSQQQKKIDAIARRVAKPTERFFRLQVVFNYGPAGSWAGAPEWAGNPEMGWCTNPLKYDANATIEHTIRITMLDRLVKIYTNGVWQNRATWQYLGPLPSPEDTFTLYAGSRGQAHSAASLRNRFNLTSPGVPADADIREIVFSRQAPAPRQPRGHSAQRSHYRYLVATCLSFTLLLLLLLLLLRLAYRRRLCCRRNPRRQCISTTATLMEVTPNWQASVGLDVFFPSDELPEPPPATATAPSTEHAASLPSVPHISPLEITLCSLIGRGGMAEVFLSEWLEMHVAIKVLHAPARVRGQSDVVMVEAQLLAHLRHPCICSFFGTTLIDGHQAMVLEYLEGGSLEAMLCRARESASALPTALLCRVSSEVAAGLAFLHRNGIIHRDVKAANVLLTAMHHAKVADFGISKFQELLPVPGGMADENEPGGAQGEQHTLCAGTTRYAAPETFGLSDGASPPRVATYDERVDVYSFGLLLWEMAHNEIVFVTMAPLAAAFKAMAGVRPDISLDGARELGDLGELIAQCWRQEPSERIPMHSCAEKLGGIYRRVAGLQAAESGYCLSMDVQPTYRIAEDA